MVQNTRAAKRGVELPFTTVEAGLEYGAQKVAEFMQQRQEEYQQQAEQQSQLQATSPNEQFTAFPGTPLNLEELEPLNFNLFLEEYEDELERNLELADQSNVQDILKSQDDEQDREREDDFDLDTELDDVGELEPSDSKLKRRNDKKKTTSKSKNRSEKQSKKKAINASRNQQRNNRDRAASMDKDQVATKKKVVTLSQQQQQKQQQKEQNVQQTKKVITARNTEIIAKDDATGQKITRQTENVKNQVVGGNGKTDPVKAPASKGKSIAGKIAEAKLTMQVEAMVQGAALTTHQTGRTTEFTVGKDTLKFERIGEDTFAFKNGTKVPIETAHEMLKDLGRSLGPQKMEQMSQIVKVAEQNPGIRTLAQNKTEKTTEQTQEQQVKVVRVHAR